jgi:hypothetical protein
MDKYTLLILLNMPFVIFGLINAFILYRDSSLGRFSLFIRIVFWTLIALGLIFAQQVYNFLVRNDLTNSQPLSLADVVLVTGVNFCMFLSLRLYTRLEHTERRLTDLHEKLSIILSEKD